ncbi:MAG: hypothetical protein JWQ25_3124 [Daejeonella sp.]|nr:hypothetical protein [Daejeonella sp.]
MIPRGKLDIAYADIFAGLGFCFRDYLSPDRKFESQLPTENLLTCLSVRSGFDLVLQALALPPGTEVLVTDISIPGMFQILEAHQLKAVGLPINRNSLSISISDFEAAITDRSKVVIFTHLFGGVMELDELAKLAKARGLFVIEDCAQAYTGADFSGQYLSDVRMFSFGMIKTNTALSGALLYIRDAEFCKKLTAIQHVLPQQNRVIYFKKLCLAFLIKLLTARFVYSIFYRLISGLGKDADEVLSGFTRGFPGNDILTKIRFKPGFAIRAMIQRKVKNFNVGSIDLRRDYALDILAAIPSALKIGSKNKLHSYWVLPIEAQDPEYLIKFLRSAGFDATAKASSLVKLQPTIANPDELSLRNVVYLPMWAEMKKKERVRLREVLNKAVDI